MNRETKRMLQRQGSIGDDGEPTRQRRQPSVPKPKDQRQRPIAWARTFSQDVVTEMKKVVWPSRQDVINYSIVVFIMLLVLTAMIGGLDYGFTRAALRVFK
ncbi:MAG: preprotein translocase subunit SecE [Acidimicrobiales bacterium]